MPAMDETWTALPTTKNVSCTCASNGTEATTPVVPVMVGEDWQAVLLWKALFEAGIRRGWAALWRRSSALPWCTARKP